MRKKYNLVVLSDNLKGDEALLCEHGLCAYLDTGKYKVLLDTGASDQFIFNAYHLGIDLKTVDYVFISHGHSDHMGGLTSFLELNSEAIVLLSSKMRNRTFYSTRSGGIRNIGSNFDWEKYQERCYFIDAFTAINDEISIFPCDCHDFAMPKANSTLFSDSGSGLEADDFSHELVVGLGSFNPVIYTGCAHNGLLNILESFSKRFGKEPAFVFGGFHLLDGQTDQLFETEQELKQIGVHLKTHYSETSFLTGHCTGNQAFKLFENQLNRHISTFYTGHKAWI